MKSKKMKTSAARETRLLVYMSNAQRRGLRAAAKRTKTSQQALIRKGIDMVLKAGA
jgi:hypothetical protein